MAADMQELKDYHLFTCDDDYYLLNIDDMTSFCIDRDQYSALKRIKDGPFDREGYEDLRIYLGLLNLISSGKRCIKIPDSHPVGHIMLNITQDCNLKCRYCYGVGGEYGSRGYMSRETAFRSVDWLIRESGDLKELVITFFGGEPLLNIDVLKEVVEYAEMRQQEKRIIFGLITNGTLLSDELISYFNEHRIRVGVSFDAVEELQNRYRPFKDGRGSYDTVRKGISDLVASGLRHININCMVADEDIDFREVRKSLIRTGCSTMIITRPSPPLLDSTDADDIAIFNQVRSGKAEEYTEKLVRFIEEEGQDWLASIRERKVFHSKLFSGVIGQLHARKRREYFCGAGKRMVNISISGDIYPCHRFNGTAHMKMGSIDDFDTGSKRRYMENHTSAISECSRCPVRYFCGAGCIYDNLAMEGRIDRPYKVWCSMIKKAVEMGIVICHQLDESDRDYLEGALSGYDPVTDHRI